jgi:hypothetical protein
MALLSLADALTVHSLLFLVISPFIFCQHLPFSVSNFTFAVLISQASAVAGNRMRCYQSSSATKVGTVKVI